MLVLFVECKFFQSVHIAGIFFQFFFFFFSPYCSLANIPLTPETARDQERRIRREIANSNERRRMQSINAGFQSLKTLIPHSDGEKLSKVTPLVVASCSDGAPSEASPPSLFLSVARPPSCSRRQSTSSLWSRRRRGYCSRTAS